MITIIIKGIKKMKLTKKVKKREIEFFVSDHAYSQFTKRIKKIENNLSPNQLITRFIGNFKDANKLKVKSKGKRLRDEKYDDNAIFYRNRDFNFVVVGNTIVTTEFNELKDILIR